MAARVVGENLADLGIACSYDISGRPIWSLQIVTDDPGCSTRTAYFDTNLSKWRLDRSPGLSDHHESSRSSRYLPDNHVIKTPYSTVAVLNQKSWTDTLPRNEHTLFFLDTRWVDTPLGHYDTWDHALRLYVHMLFSDSRGAVIYWGPQRIAIYNEALLPVIGRMHPTLMGQSFENHAPDLHRTMEPTLRGMETGGIIPPTTGVDIPLERHGYVEESWWNLTVIPLINHHGRHGGSYLSALDVTRTVLRDRTTALIEQLGRPLAALDSASIWQHIHDVLAESPRDIPMAIAYGRHDSELNDQKIHLRQTLGVGSLKNVIPTILDLSSSETSDPVQALLCRACDSNTDYIVIDLEKEPTYSVLVDHEEWLGHGEASRFLIGVSLRFNDLIRGFVMLGLNPRRDFDADQEAFVSDLVRQLKSMMARIVAKEETAKREEYLVKELTDSERRASKMAEEVPVGIYDLSADGTMLWANTSFFDIMGTDPAKRDVTTFDWRDYIAPEDQERANMMMYRCIVEKVKISDSLRLQRGWTPPGVLPRSIQDKQPCWVLYSASPDLGPDGTVQSLMGCINDISHLKWAEKLQAGIADAAEMERRKQEEFIDITSHEIRNPLSAITQCADSIIATFHEMKEDSDVQSLKEIIKMNVEDAESILFCTVHQRRIINDILTLGKLDSGLLTVAPISFHPQSLVDEAMQMFKAEFEASRIDVKIVTDAGSVLGNEDSVRGDCARMMQILVNLLTNAIKFTRTERKREITIRLGASLAPPTEDMFGKNFHWNATETTRPDLTLDSEYGSGPSVYLYYCVIDTGKGIRGEFANRVFSKFEQADRRTHTKYGGSGLGLFISRELTELQGGRIGVESKENFGSTFVFYTKAKAEQSLQYHSLQSQRRGPVTANTSNEVSEAEAQKMQNDSLYKATRKAPRAIPVPGLNYEVLLVEDNILNQKVLAKQLTKAGCVVHVANDGEEATDFVLQSVSHRSRGKYSVPDFSVPLDCILMDWEMPVCDGLTATKRIREIELQHNMPRNVIIGITANARPEQMAKAMEAGMDSIVPKPFRVPELLIRISEQVQAKEEGIGTRFGGGRMSF